MHTARFTAGHLGVPLTVATLVLTGCQTQPDEPRTARPSPAAPTDQAVESTPPPEPGTLVVPARANIFGAGKTEPPAPEGGGGGELPPGWALPDGKKRVVTFPEVTGEVTPVTGVFPLNSAAGDGSGPTDVKSWEGISGVVHRKNGMFLLGVFLGDTAPARAPKRLEYPSREDRGRQRPQLGQTFLIGDGRGRSYLVPKGATRLHLGFADSFYYHGRPGFYNNNSGKLEVSVEVAVDGSVAPPPPGL